MNFSKWICEIASLQPEIMIASEERKNLERLVLTEFEIKKLINFLKRIKNNMEEQMSDLNTTIAYWQCEWGERFYEGD